MLSTLDRFLFSPELRKSSLNIDENSSKSPQRLCPAGQDQENQDRAYENTARLRGYPADVTKNIQEVRQCV